MAGSQRTSGGSSETLAKLLAVMPIGPDAPWQVTKVTPVAKRPSAVRSGIWFGSAVVAVFRGMDQSLSYLMAKRSGIDFIPSLPVY